MLLGRPGGASGHARVEYSHALLSGSCADLFGRRNAGVVYGWVFAAHQLGAAGAAWGAGLVRDAVGSYGWAFSSAGGVAIVAGLAATMIRRPTPMLGGAT